MEKFNRAERRAQIARLKANRKFYYNGGVDPRQHARNSLVPLDERALGHVVQYPANCSCFACGNPRRHFGTPSFQELCANQRGLTDYDYETS